VPYRRTSRSATEVLMTSIFSVTADAADWLEGSFLNRGLDQVLTVSRDYRRQTRPWKSLVPSSTRRLRQRYARLLGNSIVRGVQSQ
jgi:hypothetical protein